MRRISAILFALGANIAIGDSTRVAAEYGQAKPAANMCLLKSFRVHTQIEAQKRAVHLGKDLEFVSQPLPEFPRELLNANVVGTAVISFAIAADGTTKEIAVVKKTAPEFATASLAAVKRWRFVPPTFIDRQDALAVEATFDFSIFEEEVPNPKSRTTRGAAER
jgi:TonB family protein